MVSSRFDQCGPQVVTHHLSIDPAYPPVRKKWMTFAPERNEIINAEVDRLLEAQHVKEVHYPAWLANTVVVPKKWDKWRVYVDYTDLNKAFPKDSFPIPKINQLVDSTACNDLLSFMDTYSGYNQIKMHHVDQDKTSFITSRGLYYYKVKPFGWKNAGATYQRLVNLMFQD